MILPIITQKLRYLQFRIRDKIERFKTADVLRSMRDTELRLCEGFVLKPDDVSDECWHWYQQQARIHVAELNSIIDVLSDPYRSDWRRAFREYCTRNKESIRERIIDAESRGIGLQEFYTTEVLRGRGDD